MLINDCEFTKIEEEYKWIDDPFFDSKILKVFNNLKIEDKRLYIIYIETNSSRKTGDILGVSHTTILNKIRQITKALKLELCY